VRSGLVIPSLLVVGTLPTAFDKAAEDLDRLIPDLRIV
jgi:hypothetical protein